jgi:hypothetical protein
MAKKTFVRRVGRKNLLMWVVITGLVITNLIMFWQIQALQESERTDASTWLGLEVQVQKLKNCIEQGQTSCNASPTLQDLNQ